MAGATKTLFAEVLRICWSGRSWACRLAMAGAVAGLAMFGVESAGTAAALGGAGFFAGVFLDDLQRQDRGDARR